MDSPQVPPAASEHARALDLGAPVLTYEVMPASQVRNAAIVMVVLAIICGVAVWYFLDHTGDTGASRLIAAVVAVLAGAQAVFALVRLVSRMPHLRRHLTIFERGLVDTAGPSVRATADFRGADVTEEVTRNIRNGIDVGLTVVLKMRGPRTDWQLTGPRTLLTDAYTPIAIQAGKTRAVELLAGIEAGQTAEFGTLALRRDGVLLPRGEVVPFDAVRDFGVSAGTWSLTYGGVVRHVVTGSVNETHNYRSMLVLLHHLAPNLQESR